MTVNVAFGEATDTAPEDSIFIQGDDLASFGLSDFLNSETEADKKAKFFYGLLLTMENHDYSDVLGLNVTAGTLIGQSATAVGKTITFTYQKFINTDNGSMGALTVPSSGANSGVGELALTDLFANCAKVASGANYPSTGIAIAYSDLDPHTQVDFASLNVGNDCREVINALMKSLSFNIEVRSATVSSSITATATNADGILILPAAATADTDPTTDFSAEDLQTHTFLQRTDTFTYSATIDLVNGSSGVNIATL